MAGENSELNNAEKMSKELVDIQIRIKELKRQESALKEALLKYFDSNKFQGADFTYNKKKFKALVSETKVTTPLSEKEKMDNIEMALISIKNMTLDEKTKSQMIVSKLKEGAQISRASKTKKVVKIIPVK